MQQHPAIQRVQAVKHASQLRYWGHALKRMIERGIGTRVVKEALNTALEVVEERPEGSDLRILFLGWFDRGQRPLHVVVKQSTTEVVTVYEPSPPNWSNPRTRGGAP